MANADAFQWYKWYPKDYRASRAVQRMSYIERGFYRELLDEISIEGFIPDDIDELAEVCGCPVEVMLEAWPRLGRSFHIVEPGKLSNRRMDEVISDREVRRGNSSLGGKKSAELRALRAVGEHENPQCDVDHPSSGLQVDFKSTSCVLQVGEEKEEKEERDIAQTENPVRATDAPLSCEDKTQDQDSLLTSPPASPEKSSLLPSTALEGIRSPSPIPQPPSPARVKAAAKPARLSDAQVVELYALYPRHEAKGDAIKAFRSAVELVAKRENWTTDQTFDWMAERVKSFATVEQAKPEGDRKYTPLPATWCNKGRYDDEPIKPKLQQEQVYVTLSEEEL